MSCRAIQLTAQTLCLLLTPGLHQAAGGHTSVRHITALTLCSSSSELSLLLQQACVPALGGRGTQQCHTSCKVPLSPTWDPASLVCLLLDVSAHRLCAPSPGMHSCQPVISIRYLVCQHSASVPAERHFASCSACMCACCTSLHSHRPVSSSMPATGSVQSRHGALAPARHLWSPAPGCRRTDQCWSSCQQVMCGQLPQLLPGVIVCLQQGINRCQCQFLMRCHCGSPPSSGSAAHECDAAGVHDKVRETPTWVLSLRDDVIFYLRLQARRADTTGIQLSGAALLGQL